MKTLTLELLHKEYLNWSNSHGTGRNKEDLRFGQYIWSEYHVRHLFAGKPKLTDGFNTESPSEALEQISMAL